MASDSGESFGQKSPPLYKIIQGILQDYPSGQIFKEVIQNADDARATAVKFFLDCRDVQTLPNSLVDPARHNELLKYRGPALVAVNNAAFTQADWDGIQSLQDSNKAKDPNKVGKFGIGFNSVYHITDLPVIISEQYCAFLEPHKVLWNDDPGQLFKLSELKRIEPNFLTTYSPFGELHGDRFSNQTIFRFPLRQSESKLSNELYSMKKLEQLVGILHNEAHYLLLFLRSVQSIQVIKIDPLGRQSKLFKVSISSEDKEKVRQNFFQKMESLAQAPANEILDVTSFYVHVEEAERTRMHHWTVAHCAGSQNEKVLELAEKQCIIPWVSTAFELTADHNERGGRIFCSLPLPSEERAPFRIDVNGTFAVCSNRRSLKWEAQERKNDEEGIWNKYLVEKCLPQCYVQMIKHLMSCSGVPHEVIYSCYPDVRLIQGTPWEGVLEPFYTQLFTQKFVYTPIKGGHWIGSNVAIFSERGESKLQTVENALHKLLMPIVKPPDVVWEAKCYTSCTFMKLTSTLVIKKLGKINFKWILSSDEMIDVLEYCLSGINRYCDLYELDLLLLADGNFTAFKHYGRHVYLSNDSIPHTLLPNVDNRFVSTSFFSLKPELVENLRKVAASEVTQLRNIDVTHIPDLLSESKAQNWSIDQLKNFWLWLQNQPLSHFVGARVIPVNGRVEHSGLCKNEIIYVSNYTSCSSLLASALSKYNLVLVKCSDFPFLKHDQLSLYLRHLTPSDILDAMSPYRDPFLTADEANELQQFFASDLRAVNHNLPKLCNVSMFQVLQNRSLCSINSARPNARSPALLEDSDFNLEHLIPSHPLVISCRHNSYKLLNLLKKRGILTIKTETEFFCEVIFPAINNQSYPEHQVNEVMLKALDLINPYSIPDIGFINSLNTVCFVPVAVSSRKCIPEVYDPSDNQLVELFKGEPVFPLEPFNSSLCLSYLRRCGMKSRDSITAGDIKGIITSLVNKSPTLYLLNYASATDMLRHNRACAVINFLNSSTLLDSSVATVFSRRRVTLSSFIASEEGAWIPVLDEPPRMLANSTRNSMLIWKGSLYKNHLVSSNDVVVLDEPLSDSTLPWIMGSSVCFMKSEAPSKLSLSHTASYLVDKVLEHFENVINERVLSNDVLKRISILTYEYLSSFDDDDRTRFSGGTVQVKDHIKIENWIWIERESQFVNPSVTAFCQNPDFQHDLAPFLHILPPEYSRFEKLFLSCGSTECVTGEQIVSTLHRLQNSPNNDRNINLAIAILQWMIDTDVDISDVLVPVESEYLELLPVSNVVYTDNDQLRCLPPPENYRLAHSKVTKEMARKLQVRPLSDQLGISQDMVISEDVGPHEPLINRLQDILQQYQDMDGYTIVKELLQNADDAEATELNIVFDSRQHTTMRLFFPEMAKAQGPALVVHNDKQFTQQDFVNITKLAGATKRGKSLKIGKFGVGFCSVYHITDVPSFVSSDQLYIFDPTLSYLQDHIKDKSQPGKKAKFTSVYLKAQVSHFENLFRFSSSQSYNGTLFRFPFRTSPSKLSKKCHDPAEYFQSLLRRLEEDGSKLLLFLNSVRKITVSELNDFSGHREIKLIIEKQSISQRQLNIALVNITCNDNRETWLVSKCHQRTEDDNRYLTASVACKIQHTNENELKVLTIDGEMFCYLPLGSIKTGLPVHVSANFAVLQNRRGIWVSDSKKLIEPEVFWNRKLMTGPVPVAYLSLLRELQDCSIGSLDGKHIIDYLFYQLWPLQNELKNKNPWNRFVSKLYEAIAREPLLKTLGSGKWCKQNQCKILHDAILCHHRSMDHLSTPDCVHKALKLMQSEPVVVLSNEYFNEIAGWPHITTFKELDFVTIFFQSIASQRINNTKLRNEVLLLVLETFSFYSDNAIEKEQDRLILENVLQSNPCIPCGINGEYLRLCNEAVDNTSSLAVLFTEDDHRFPISSFMNSPSCKRAMMKLGLIHDQLPHNLLLKCATKISTLYNTVPRQQTLVKVKILLKCLNRFEDLPSDSTLRTLAFLPILKKPDDYFLPWKGDACQQVLVPPCEVMCGDKLPHLVGSQVCILDPVTTVNVSKRTMEILGIRHEPDINMVLHQLKQLVEMCRTMPMTDELKKFITNLYTDIVHELNRPDIEQHPWVLPQQVNETTVPSQISSITCIWTGSEFVTPSCVAKKWKTAGPILYPIPSILCEKPYILKAFGCQEAFHITKLVSALRTLYETYKSSAVPPHCCNLLREVISELENFEKDDFEGPEHYLPDTSFRMRPVSQLVYKDVDWCSVSSESSFVNKMMTFSLAMKMGVRSSREKALSQHKNQFYQPFGQHEELLVRINNILQDYPFDATFIKELVQNADDAAASKIVFILDRRDHGTEKVLSDNWKELQGPSLLVWNDSVFKEKDLKGIQQLGFGGKRAGGTSETIGKYGIGFNVVYHITDCPAFVTGTSASRTLCILDPQCRYVPEATSNYPGGRYNDINSIYEQFSDVASAFSITNVSSQYKALSSEMTKTGTLFRLPFRSEERSKKSKILHPESSDDTDNTETDTDIAACSADESNTDSNVAPTVNKIVSVDHFVEKMQEWVDDIKMLLLFLTNVKCFEFYTIDCHNTTAADARHNYKMRCLLSCSNTISDKDKRIEYQDACKKFSDAPHKPAVIHYSLKCKMDLMFTEKKSSDEKWFIQQGIGDLNGPNKHWKFVKSLKPRHGIAVRLEPPIKGAFQGKLFCFLPLPGCTYLPVHLNGQFILTSARRDVWKPSSNDSKDDNSIWNSAILNALSSSYASLLQTLANRLPNDNGIFTTESYKDEAALVQDTSKYYWLFPTRRKVKIEKDGEAISVPSGDWEAFANKVFEKLYACNACILASVSRKPGVFAQPSLSIKWSKLSSCDNSAADQSYFFRDQDLQNTQVVKKELMEIGMNINEAPYAVWKAFKSVEHVLSKVDRDSVYHYCRNHCSANLPRPLKQTKFKKEDTFLTILEYILLKKDSSSEFPTITKIPFVPSTWPHDSPFLLTADNQLRLFDRDNPVISSEFYFLFPKCWHRFLHSKLIEFNMMTAYFYHHYENGDVLVMEVFSQTLPECLKDTRVTKVDLQIYQILKCIHCPPFYNCSKEILSQWALIPSESELFAKQKKNCLLPFVYLKEEIEQEDNQSQDGTNAEALDGDSSNTRSKPTDEEINEILRNLHMPALDISIFTHHQVHSNEKGEKILVTVTDTSLVKALGCPNISEPSEILQNLLFYYQSLQTHQQSSFLNDSNSSDTFLQYLGQINFKNSDAKQTIRGLPVFLTISGSLSSLSGKVYVWPDDVPKCGIEQLNQEDVSFLDSKGGWRSLGAKEALGIREIQPVQLYLDYIFPHLSSMSDSERREHLKHIKDNILDVCLATNSDRESLEAKFVHCLSNLQIIHVGDHNSKLCCVSDFADHRQPIFNVFNKRFQLLPDHSIFRTEESEEWMKFLCKIGLVSKVDKSTFVSLCRAVEKRDYSVFHDLQKASEILLDYLLHSFTLDPDKCPWTNASAVLQAVSEVKFVTVQKLPHLNQISPQYTDNCIAVESLDTDTCHLCALQDSAVVECDTLLWTVKPIIIIPHRYLENGTIKSNLQHCGMTIHKLTCRFDDVVCNMRNIAISKYAHFSLFDRYSHPPPHHLLEVVIHHFKLLSDVDQSSIQCFRSMKCMPVCIDEDQPDKLVLVEPVTVVNKLMADELKPFLHSLHRKIRNKVPITFLESIGIQTEISSEHCVHVIRQMWEYSHGQELDPNTAEKLRKVLDHFLDRLKSNPIEREQLQQQIIYLPNIKNELVLSTSACLLYCDDQRLSESVFYKKDCITNESQLCCLLPESVRPKPLSSCEWRLISNCAVLDHTELTQTLSMTFQHPHFYSTFKALLGSFKVKNHIPDDLATDIEQYVYSNVVLANVRPVDNLVVSLHMQDSYICSSLVKFFIDDRSKCIYIDSSVTSFTAGFSVFLSMPTAIIRAALPGRSLVPELQPLEMSLQLLMRAQTDEEFQSLIQHFELEVDNVDQPTVLREPKLGESVPPQLHSRLDHNQEHAVFRFKELVAYEVQPGLYVFAKIDYPVFDGNGRIPDDVEQRKYIIMYNNYGAVKQVNVLELYKFLPHSDDEEELGKPTRYIINEPCYSPRPSEAERWLRQSQVDLDVCRALSNTMIDRFAGHICFLAQQAAEKAFKSGMYAVIGEADLQHHHLHPMACILRREKPEFVTADCLSMSQRLEQYYIPTRYPNACPSSRIPAECYTVEQAQRALSDAEYIFAALTTLKTALLHAQL